MRTKGYSQLSLVSPVKQLAQFTPICRLFARIKMPVSISKKAHHLHNWAIFFKRMLTSQRCASSKNLPAGCRTRDTALAS